jgi:hypothetical protein
MHMGEMEARGQPQTTATSCMGKEPLVSLGYKAEWAPAPIRTFLEKKKFSFSCLDLDQIS